MARSSKQDPIEKFRFRVTILSIDSSLNGAFETITALSKKDSTANKYALFSRAGFNEIVLPKVNVGEITYRENIDNLRFSKIPGLVKYDPVTFRRGVTSNKDMYEWFRLINEELALLNVAQELSKDSKVLPRQSENFRKDIFIEVLDRSGESVKGWFLMNCWPNSYKPGNDLNASSDEKLIEELTVTYESFLEIDTTSIKDSSGKVVASGGLAAITKELAKSATLVAAGALLNEKLPWSVD